MLIQQLNQSGIVVNISDVAASTKKSVIHVLHVDDDPSIREISKLMLMDLESSFDIDNACCVDEALKKLLTGHYDIVISDYEMPLKNGLEFLKELREQKNDVAFIIFTGRGREDVAVKALNLGADRYIDKNGSPETVYCELADAINKTVERKKSRELLAKSESKYHSLVENSLQGIAILLASPIRIVFANTAFGKILGYSFQELTSLSPEGIMGLVHHEDRAVFFKRIENRLLGEPAEASFEFRAVRKDGSIIWLSSLANRVDYDGQPAVQGMFLDINESKKAEKLLEKERSEFGKILDSAPVMIAYKSKDDHFVSVNSAFADFAGLPKEKIVGMTTFDLVKEQDVAQQGRDHDLQVMRTGVPVLNQMVRWSGLRSQKEIWALYSKLPFHDAEGNVVGTVSYVLDVDDRKKAELELKQYNEILERVGESIDAGLAVINKDYRVVWANKRLMNLGVAPNKKCYKTFNNIGIVCPDCGVEKIFKNNSQLDVHEYKTVNSKGETTWIELRVTPLKDQNGVTMAALELVVPINERKQIEEKLREKAFLLQGVSDAVISTDSNFAIRSWNDGAKLIYGWEEAEVLGKQVQEVLKTQYSESELKSELSALYQKEDWQNEVIQKHKNGNEIYILSNVKLLKDKSGKTVGAIAVNKDITNLKKAEKFLRESEVKFRKAFETSPDACYIGTMDGVIVEVNDSFSRIWGYSKEECVGKTSLQLGLYAKGPPDRLRMLSELKSKGHFSNLEFDGKRKNGEVFQLLFSGSTLEINGKPLIYGVFRDISEQKRAEEELKKESAKMEIMNEKLNVVGRLTRHDVGNKLMVMKSNVYLLKKQIGDNPKLIKYFEGIDSAIKQSDELFEFSRFYEKIGVENPSEIDVSECFNQAVALLPTLSNIKIVNDCQGLEVTADSLLKQLFYNFLDNSLKYGEKVTQIRLSYTKEEDGVKLFYEDNGVGILEVNKPKLFHEGFTTGKSTGLGLFLIKKMVEVYGWMITEDGELGKGAKFVITIPNDRNVKINNKILSVT